MFVTEFNKKSPAEMLISGSYDAGAGSGVLNVNIKFTGEPTDSMLKLRVALVENGIRYNASNGQTVFYQVFRKMYPDVSGMAVDFNSIGQTTDISVPFSIDTATFDEDSLEFVAFLQSDVTGEILQGAKISFTDLTGVSENANGSTINGLPYRL